MSLTHPQSYQVFYQPTDIKDNGTKHYAYITYCFSQCKLHTSHFLSARVDHNNSANKIQSIKAPCYGGQPFDICMIGYYAAYTKSHRNPVVQYSHSGYISFNILFMHIAKLVNINGINV